MISSKFFDKIRAIRQRTRFFIVFGSFQGRIGRNCKISVNCKELNLGKDIVIGDGVVIKFEKGSIVRLGSNLSIGDYSCIKVGPGAKLSIGKHSRINRLNQISCNSEIVIGQETMFAAFVHVLDSNHGINNNGIAFMFQPKDVGKTIIGNNVWIGTQVSILSNTFVGNNVVLAANNCFSGNLKSDRIYYTRKKYKENL